MNALLLQFLAGLTHAMILFLIASGLSLIFGVTRTINFAHGSLYMLAAYLTVTLGTVLPFGALSPYAGMLLAPLAVALLGGIVEIGLVRRVYRAPELYQLLLTFALVLILGDVVRFFWGPEHRVGLKPPGLDGTVLVLGQLVPTYDFAVLALGPAVALGLVGSTASHPVGGPRPRGGLGSRDGGRAGRQPGLALHRRVRRRFVVGRRSGSAPGRAPAAHHGDGCRHHRRGVRGGGDRRDGQRLRRAGGGDPPRRPPVAGDRVAPPGVPARPGLSLDGRGPHPAAVGAAGSAPGRPRLGGGAAGRFRRPPDCAARAPWWPGASCS